MFPCDGMDAKYDIENSAKNYSECQFYTEKFIFGSHSKTW